MASIDLIVNEVRTYVPNCPEFIMETAVRRAMRLFCMESFYYEKTLFMDLIQGLASYDIDLDSSDEIIEIKAVQYGDCIIPPVDPAMVNRLLYNQSNSLTKNYIRAFSFEAPNYLTIYGTPVVSETEALAVRCVLQTSTTATEVPEAIYRYYATHIAAGAIGFLLKMPAQPWSDPKTGSLKDQEFWYGINEAKAARFRNFKIGTVKIRPRSFLYG